MSPKGMQFSSRIFLFLFFLYLLPPKPNTVMKLLLVPALAILLTSCFAERMDKRVSEYYGDQLPKPKKVKTEQISIKSNLTAKNDAISNITHGTEKMIPAVIYWQYDVVFTSHLNPQIPLTYFTNAVNAMAPKLNSKLNGKKLELTLEDVPSAFSLVSREHIALLVHWERYWTRSDKNDLVVSYQITGSGPQDIKSGKISIPNPSANSYHSPFRTMRSVTSEYLDGYNNMITNMTKSMLSQLENQL